MRELKKENIISKSKGKYILLGNTDIIVLSRKEIREDSEDIVFHRHIEPLIKDLPINVYNMWYYCFTEMFNNVIDHSECTAVLMYINRNYAETSIIISDDGVGIFKKIQEYYHFESMDDAILELFKGKLTTDKTHHSGEGVFFTSRIMDTFAAISDEKIFSHTEYEEVLKDLSELPNLSSNQIYQSGTTILMKLSNDSNKTNKEIMDQYADVDGGFTKTRIPLKNIYSTYPVSRSQAKRLTHRFESFQEIELDFTGIPELGQGFAHELFVVFQNQHKEIKLTPFNTNLSVQRMINHVLHD
ncbi:MAG: DUF4325 domain-containing protein [Eubacterium sp.]|nr:DUF4325 domain-containing protein [Eubacterium sp.]